MPHLRPLTELPTHEVRNQPPVFANVNLWSSDLALRDAALREAGDDEAWLADQVEPFGARTGSAEVIRWGFDANRHRPELVNFDRFGQRVDEVRFHPCYHKLMALAVEVGMPSVAWTETERPGHLAHAVLEFLMSQAEPGVCCPLSMTYAVVPALRHQPDLADELLPKLTARRYDPRFMPIGEKYGLTMGMAMTEKQGGSDVRANTTKATPLGGGEYELLGHKWFCSAPMSDGFLVLAQAPGGLSCFFVPRWRPDGIRNPFYVQRLKDKLGDHANASSEIEFYGTWARMVGEEGRGVRTIIEMVHHTRLDCVVSPAAFMRQSVANACWHAAHRSAFGKILIDQPLMRGVLADLVLESEAGTILAMHVAKSFDDSSKEGEVGVRARLLSRLMTPVAKYWLNKRLPELVYESMECHGGAGYIEEGVMARLYRQSPLNSIWEGSGNVICLDVLRAMGREPACVEVMIDELRSATGSDKRYDQFVAGLSDRLTKPVEQAEARQLCESLGLALQGSLLLRYAPSFVADAFCAGRLEGEGRCYGTLPAGVDVGALLERGRPAV
ncbi:acyl-CoA dehydrogenase family protein [Pseudenhygromyxa sp. WMMC2535]|uniref:acyl-CoA dehydrogenase family protein n=1 Tax=Pseudenhygromyxa sp. WMMC2535 TaxID=2712867 RepID=UPI001551ADAE|nr:acyl-CoA dehydrogenase family protein [Pseudenhygromyxa sp. WMMC2535]NVB36990.1 acyl-CoA dehydrogenase family protein [Pseudenhygromyxa sp. WMMC2535]